MDIDSALEIEERLFGDCFQSDEQVDRMKKFLEKGKKKKDKSKNLRETENKEAKTPEEIKEEKKEKAKEKDVEYEEFLNKELAPLDTFKGMNLLEPFTTPKMPAILTAGNKEKHNSLTIGWGLLGVAWSKPLFMVLVKPDRYTYQFMEKTEYFTVSFIKKELYSKFALYGTQSGRDIDKEEESGTHIQFLDNGGITFKEAEEVYVCKVLARSYFDEKNLAPEITDFYTEMSKKFKQNTEPHGAYIGEIIGHYKK